jgi:hypothetical protein
MRAMGLSTLAAESILASFERSQAILESDLDALTREKV